MTEFLQHLATFGADHVCSSMFPFFSLPLAFGMTDGERRCSCKLHVYLFYWQSKKKTSPILLKSSARLSPGKDQPTRLTWLDESLAWVLTEVSLLRIYNMCVQQSASQAILQRPARSLPMFRADCPPFALETVEHSRYLPTSLQLLVLVCMVQWRSAKVHGNIKEIEHLWFKI
jgi:hypothetical protein